MFVLDQSTSVGATKFIAMKSFLSQLVTRMDVNSGSTRVGLLTYSTAVGASIHLNQYSTAASLQSAISLLTYSGGHYFNTAAALAYVRTTMLGAAVGDRGDVANVVVVLTAGRSTDITAARVGSLGLQTCVILCEIVVIRLHSALHPFSLV